MGLSYALEATSFTFITLLVAQLGTSPSIRRTTDPIWARVASLMAATDERKPVTVLFADLKGSAELATKHDPEQLHALRVRGQVSQSDTPD